MTNRQSGENPMSHQQSLPYEADSDLAIYTEGGVFEMEGSWEDPGAMRECSSKNRIIYCQNVECPDGSDSCPTNSRHVPRIAVLSGFSASRRQ